LTLVAAFNGYKASKEEKQDTAQTRFNRAKKCLFFSIPFAICLSFIDFKIAKHEIRRAPEFENLPRHHGKFDGEFKKDGHRGR